MRIIRCLPVVLAAAVALAAAQARGQALADKVPADALLYAGWEGGSEGVGKAYAGSHLKGLLEALDVPTQLSAFIQERQAKETDANKVEQGKVFQEWLTAAGESPTAVYVAPVEFGPQGRPMPRMAVISKVGKAVAAGLAEKMNPVMQRNQKPGQPVTAAVAVEEYLLITVGEGMDVEKRLAGTAGKVDSLADLKEFKEGFARLAGGVGKAAGPASVFVNWEQCLKNIDERMDAGANQNFRRMWPRVVDALGLDEMRYVAWTGAFDGADWRSEGFVAFNAKRTGLMGLLDNKPLSEGALKLIPATATSAGVLRFDGVRLMEELRDAAARGDDRGAQQFDALLKNAFLVTGIDIQKDLFPALSDEFVYYAAPDATGTSRRGLTMINKLKDAKKGEEVLGRVSDFIDAAIAQRDPSTTMQFKESKLAAPLEGVTVHTLVMPNGQPTWAIDEGMLFVATSPAAVQAAIEGLAAGKGSIAENAEFAALRKKLGVEKMSSFSFYDLSKTAPELYELASQGMARAMAANPERKLPLSLPPIDKLKPHLGAALDVYWSDEAGWHMKGVGPFPLSSVLSTNGLMMQGLMQRARQAQRGGGAGAPAEPRGGGMP